MYLLSILSIFDASGTRVYLYKPCLEQAYSGGGGTSPPDVDKILYAEKSFEKMKEREQNLKQKKIVQIPPPPSKINV